jgi:methyl-accepting chemotaxis protein
VTEDINQHILAIQAVVEQTAKGAGELSGDAGRVSRLALRLNQITAHSRV